MIVRREEFEQYLLHDNMTIREAMQIIDKNRHKAAVLVTNEKLAGTVTDGDIRRYLLQDGSIDDSVLKAVNYHPYYVYEDDELVDYKQYMIKQLITLLPVVDENGFLVRIEVLNPTKQIRKITEDNVPLVVMAGGLGTRLKPYTDIIPKPLIPIGDKTITEHILERFGFFGCKQFYLIVNYKKKLIEAYFKEEGKYLDIQIVEEPFFMGTAGGICLLKEKLEENFFLVNCDILIDGDYYQIWEEHLKSNNLITIVSAKTCITIPYGTIVADKENRVLSLKEKPSVAYSVNTGMYVCNTKIFHYIREEKIDMPDLIQRCINAGEKIGKFEIDENEWYDMGQPNQLEKMKKSLGIV